MLFEGYAGILADKIDAITSKPREERTRLTHEYIPMILQPLAEAGVPIETLEHLDIEFVDPDMRRNLNDIKVEVGTWTGMIQTEISRVLGPEILSRLDLSYSEEVVYKRMKHPKIVR